MVIQLDTRSILVRIDKFLKIKESSVGDPDIYSGAKLKKLHMDNDVWCWSISPSKYVQEVVRNCQKYLKENLSDEYELIANAPKLFPLGYEPCMYVYPLLLHDEESYFQTIIDVMRWMVDLVKIEISVEVSHLSSFLTMPRQGHLVNALHIMSYLKINHKSRLVLDPSYPGIYMFEFKSNDN